MTFALLFGRASRSYCLFYLVGETSRLLAGNIWSNKMGIQLKMFAFKSYPGLDSKILHSNVVVSDK